MRDVIVLALRALLGGALVVGFSLIGEWLRPKSFGGVFAAAPSVALASLLITLFVDGGQAAWRSALGMIAGAVALVAACVVGIETVKRFRAPRGATAAVGVWCLVAVGLWAVTLR